MTVKHVCEIQYNYDFASCNEICCRKLNHEMDILDSFNIDYQCALADIKEDIECAQVLFVPSINRVGIKWLGHVLWFDACSVEDALTKYIVKKKFTI